MRLDSAIQKNAVVERLYTKPRRNSIFYSIHESNKMTKRKKMVWPASKAQQKNHHSIFYIPTKEAMEKARKDKRLVLSFSDDDLCMDLREFTK
jgi:hypothetical protein